MSVKSGSDRVSKSDKKGESSANLKSQTGTKGLIQAVVNKDVASIKMLIKTGIDINQPDEHGWSALRKASRAGDMTIVSLLLDNGAKVTDKDRIVVITAASWGRVDVLRQLLEANAKVDDSAEWEVSPLVSAARYGHLAVVKLLIEYEADINQPDQQGNDALMIAWESNWPDIVFYLVEMGGNLKNQDDWLKLAASPATAAKISQGIHFRQKARIEGAEARGDATIETYKTDVKIPLDALCRWLELVPMAALGLLDRVLFLTPKDSPVRADLKKQKMRTAYLDINEWTPKEEPLLLSLAPKKEGRDVVVATKVLHQQGVLSQPFLFALTLSKTDIFNSSATQAVLFHIWRSIVCRRFYFDFLLELIGVILLLAWWIVTVQDGDELAYKNRKDELPLLYTCWGVIILVNLVDAWDEMRQLYIYKSKNYMDKYDTWKHLCTTFGIIVSFAWVAVLCIAEVWNTQDDADISPSLQVGYVLTAIVIALRWLRILTCLPIFEAIGPIVIPVLKSFSAIAPFLVVSVTFIAAFAHVTGVLGDFRSGQVDILKGFWQLCLVGYALTLVVTLAFGNILCSILDEQYDLQHERGLSQFLEYRAKTCFSYFTAIMARNPLMAPGEKVLQTVFPRIFPKPPTKGYLWSVFEVDETAQDGNLGQDNFRGRLGLIKYSAQETMDKTYKELHNRIQDMQARLNKEMKLARGDSQSKADLPGKSKNAQKGEAVKAEEVVVSDATVDKDDGEDSDESS